MNSSLLSGGECVNFGALGGVRDANWSDRYAEYLVAEQAGKELPQ